MSNEITIFEMYDDNQTFIESGIELPAPIESVEKALAALGVDRPYRPYAYSFRLKGLDGRIAGTQELDELNAFAERLSNLSEFERVKLEGALEIQDGKAMSIKDCVALIYNLECFELTPNAGDYETLGRQFAAQKLSQVPPHLMELINYEKLGRLKHDDNMSAFVGGHLVRDTGQKRREFTPDHDPLACPLKMRICSNDKPNGVWIKFPLWFDDDAHMDTPEESREIHVALAALQTDSLDKCRAVECISEYPSLQRCLETHAKLPMKSLLWKALNFGYAESELGASGKAPYKVFAAAMEYENCSNLDLATDITQNLRCYDFAPDAIDYALNHLEQKGIDHAIASCFDLEAVSKALTASNNAKMTKAGMISRNSIEFSYEYFHEPKATTIRLFCPLEVIADPDSGLGKEYGIHESEFGDMIIPNNVVACFEDEILLALKKEHAPEEGGKGLAHYLGNESFAPKVSYIWPSVEIWKSELWGVMEIKASGELTQQEMKELTEWCLGQLSDGMGEGFEQRPIRTSQGDMYVSFWHSGGDYFLKPEHELKGMEPEPNQGQDLVMGGMM